MTIILTNDSLILSLLVVVGFIGCVYGLRKEGGDIVDLTKEEEGEGEEEEEEEAEYDGYVRFEKESSKEVNDNVLDYMQMSQRKVPVFVWAATEFSTFDSTSITTSRRYHQDQVYTFYCNIADGLKETNWRLSTWEWLLSTLECLRLDIPHIASTMMITPLRHIISKMTTFVAGNRDDDDTEDAASASASASGPAPAAATSPTTTTTTTAAAVTPSGSESMKKAANDTAKEKEDVSVLDPLPLSPTTDNVSIAPILMAFAKLATSPPPKNSTSLLVHNPVTASPVELSLKDPASTINDDTARMERKDCSEVQEQDRREDTATVTAANILVTFPAAAPAATTSSTSTSINGDDDESESVIIGKSERTTARSTSLIPRSLELRFSEEVTVTAAAAALENKQKERKQEKASIKKPAEESKTTTHAETSAGALALEPTEAATTTTSTPGAQTPDSSWNGLCGPVVEDTETIPMGARLGIWWDGDRTYYPCTVVNQRTRKNKDTKEEQKYEWFLEYDDGTVEWLDLTREQVCWITGEDTAPATAGISGSLIQREVTSNNTDDWDLMFCKLLAYKGRHNDTMVPRRYEEDTELGQWVNEQRICYKRGILLEPHF